MIHRLGLLQLQLGGDELLQHRVVQLGHLGHADIAPDLLQLGLETAKLGVESHRA